MIRASPQQEKKRRIFSLIARGTYAARKGKATDCAKRRGGWLCYKKKRPTGKAISSPRGAGQAPAPARKKVESVVRGARLRTGKWTLPLGKGGLKKEKAHALQKEHEMERLDTEIKKNNRDVARPAVQGKESEGVEGDRPGTPARLCTSIDQGKNVVGGAKGKKNSWLSARPGNLRKEIGGNPSCCDPGIIKIVHEEGQEGCGRTPGRGDYLLIHEKANERVLSSYGEGVSRDFSPKRLKGVRPVEKSRRNIRRLCRRDTSLRNKDSVQSPLEMRLHG